MQKVFELIETVAPTDTTVLIRGESGTGKELVARAIHANSQRRYFPIVTVNCGALPESLLESELFGHEKGRVHRRAVPAARESSSWPTAARSSSTRSATSTRRRRWTCCACSRRRSSRASAATSMIKVDFRVICATNKNLEKAVADGTFREDLYYRLNVFSIDVPPLRERRRTSRSWPTTSSRSTPGPWQRRSTPSRRRRWTC